MKKSGMIRWVRNWSFGFKMLMIIVVASLLLLCGNFASLQINRQAYDEMLYVKTAQVFTSYVRFVETEIDRMDVVTLSVIGDSDVQKHLTVLRDQPVNSTEWREAKNDLSTKVRSYSGSMGYCLYFGVYVDKYVTAGSINDLTIADKKELVALAAEKQGGSRVVLYGDQLYYIREIREKAGLSLAYLGTMIGRLDTAKLFRDCNFEYEKMGISMDMTVYVGDFPIYQSGQQRMEPLPDDGWEIRDNHFVVQSTTKDGWVYVVHMPYDQIHSTLQNTTVRTVVLTFVIAILAMVISYILVGRVTGHLNKLLIKYDAYRNGVLPTKEEMSPYQDRGDEIGRLHRHFDRMAYEYKQLNDKSYNQMLLQKEAQYQQLQQQIQPHFIFNTLSHITWIAYEHKDQEIADLSNALSRMLRSSMTFTGKTVRLADELKLVEDYMLIQERRYHSRLCFEIDVDPQLEDVRLPQMTIQPIVENAVKYVLEEALDTCIIRVIGRREGDDALLIVEDDGPGIDEAIMEKLESQQIKAKGNGIGLRNIQKRLQLIFSEEYGLSFHRVNDRTQVWIKVPIQKKEKEESCII